MTLSLDLEDGTSMRGTLITKEDIVQSDSDRRRKRIGYTFLLSAIILITLVATAFIPLSSVPVGKCTFTR